MNDSNVTPLHRMRGLGEDPDELDEAEEAYALGRAEVRQVLAGFLAVPIPGRAMGDGSSIEYELVETRLGAGVRTRLPNDRIDADWGFLVCGRRPHAHYLEVRQQFHDDEAWEVRDTLAPDGQVLARAAQENAWRAAAIADTGDWSRSFLG